MYQVLRENSITFCLDRNDFSVKEKKIYNNFNSPGNITIRPTSNKIICDTYSYLMSESLRGNVEVFSLRILNNS